MSTTPHKCNNINCTTNIHSRNKYCCATCKKIGVATSCKNTNLLKYGVENPSQLESVKDKKKNTCMINYGVSSPLKSAAIRDKVKDTCLEKYGVSNPQQNKQVRQKSIDTCVERYGCENPGQSEEIKKVMKNTCLEKYGVEYAWQSDFTKDQVKITNNKLYSVDYPMQDPVIFGKMQKSGRKTREYTFNSGRVVDVRGHEPLALDILITKYNEDDIITSSKDMPIIWYELDDKRKRYHPDIFIISENKFIEVKSLYTYHADLEKNLLKQQACIDSGFNFEFMIFVKGQLQ